MKKVNQLKVGAILSYISLFLFNIISILYTPIMLRVLGQSEYGLYTLSNSIVGYLGVLNFGIGNAIVRYTAKYRAENNKEGEYNLNGMFLVVYSLLGVIVFILGSIFVFNSDSIFSQSLKPSELATMKILLSIMVFNLAISFPFAIFESIITAYEKFVFPKVVVIIRTIINPMIMIPLLFIGYKSVAMTIVSTILNLVCISLNIYYCFKFLKIKIKFNCFDIPLLKEISIYSFFIFLNLIIDKIYWSTDQFILGAVVSSSAVAVYSIGSVFNTYYMAFSTAISGVFLPKITTMVTKNSSDQELSDLFIKIGRLQGYIMFFILSGFILVGRKFIALWAGKGYEDSFFIAVIVMIPLTVPLIQNLGISIMQAKNKHKFRSKVYLIIAIMNIVLTIPLAKQFGGIGAAISTGIAFVIGQIVIMNVYYYKEIKLDIPRFWREISKIICFTIIALVSTSLITNFINISVIFSIILEGTLLGIIFLGLMKKFCFNEYEKELFLKPLYILLNKFKRVKND
ncbi:MAG: oligosaccharide flippase family protein [Sarcina sp.]